MWGSEKVQRAAATVGLLAAVASPSTAEAATKRADLALKSPKVGISSALPAKPLELSVTVRNAGKATAKASTLRGYLSTKGKHDKTDLPLLGKVAVKSIKAGKSVTVKGTVMVPATAPTGTYRVILCADDAEKVKESSEKNNCLVVPGAFTVLSAQTTPGVVPGTTSPLPGGLPGPSNDPGTNPGPNDPGPNTPAPTTPTPTTPVPTTPVPPAPDLPGGKDPVPTPPAPPTARALTPTAAVTTAEASAFLYEGTGAVQTGVDPDDIDESRAGVLRGKVLQTDGTPLPGVTVTVTDHPELGQTVTRTDGHYDLAVNGGENLTLHFERPTYLPADRLVASPVRDYDVVDELVMKRFDSKKTDVTAGAATAQVAVSTITSDSDGSRRANLIFLPDTHATMTLADGSTRPLSNTMTVRATEYTVGERGPDSMPASLPPTSGYTYAVDYTVDEAVEAGATKVSFDKPVVTYTDNFLGFPVGGVVPAGSYDGVIDQWRPERNGVVLKIVAVVDGSAQVDVTGDGTADTGQALTDLGFTAAELQQLAGLYEAGKTLWRVRVTHFTPWDYNWPYGPPPGSNPPNPPKPPKPPKRPKNPKDPKDPCKKPSGSWVECDSRALRETLPLAGTPFTLNYNSDRSEGRRSLAVEIPMSGATVPSVLKRIDLEVRIAGRLFKESFPAAANQTTTFEWDGKDAYGRRVERVAQGTATIYFVYDTQYMAPGDFQAAFARLRGQQLDTLRDGRREIRLARNVDFELGTDVIPPASLGGWTISASHALDTGAGVVSLGTGDRQVSPTKAISRQLSNIRDDAVYNQSVRAIDQPVWQADGSAWFPDVKTTFGESQPYSLRIKRVSPDGATTSTVATFPSPPTSSGSYDLVQMAKAPDGGVYVLPKLSGDRGGVIWHVTPAGVIKQITAGSAFAATPPTEPLVGQTGMPGPGGDGQPASQVVLDGPQALATGPDGSLYVASSASSPTRSRIQQISADGIIRTVWSSNGIVAVPGLNNTGSVQKIVWSIEGLAVGQDGAIFFQTLGYDASYAIFRLSPTGVVEHVAGAENRDPACCKNGQMAREVRISSYGPIALTPSGDVVFSDTRTINRVTPDGRLEVLAGNASSNDPSLTPTASALDTNFTNTRGLAIAADGRIAVATTASGLRTIEPGILGYSFTGYPVPIAGQESTAVFDSAGRHLKTVDTITGATLLEFAYDSAGRLLRITDRDGRATTIERDGAGKPTAVVAPGGERTALSVDASGNLVSVKRDGVPATTLTYKAGGLLTKETDAGGGTHTFGYDVDGFLISDQDPDGITTTVTADDSVDGVAKTTLTLPSGRATSYANSGDELVGWTRKVTGPTGAVSELTVAPDGKATSKNADGSTTTVTRASDARFGALNMYESAVSIKEPSGAELVTTTLREPELVTPTTLFPLKSLTQTRRMDGSTVSTLFYDNATNTVRDTYADGVRTTKTFDAKQRTKSVSRFAGADDMTYAYNARGLPSTITRGSEQTTLVYDARDRLSTKTDALGRQTTYTTDATGRTSSVKVPGGQTYAYGYDALDRLTQVTLPGGAKHQLTYTPAGRSKSYLPPGGGASGYVNTRDADGVLSKVTLPGSRAINYARDAGGRLASTSYPEASIAFAYAGTDDRLGSLTRTPTAGGGTSALAWTYDGALVKSLEATGASSGKYAYTYDSRFRLTGSTLTTGSETRAQTIDYGSNNLVVGRDGYQFNRGGPIGGVQSISGNGLSSSYSWDGHGRTSARTDTVGGSAAYGMTLTRDNAGRITKKVEVSGGASHTYDYEYDANGRLIQVGRDGTVAEGYTYDADGNRLSRTVGGTTKSATYEASSTAIKTYDGKNYTVTSDGFLTARGTDAFTWSARGELLSAAVAGGTTTYAYDGFGRRVATTTGSQTTKYLYGNPAQVLQVTATVAPDGTVTTLNYNDMGFLIGFVRGTTRYNVATDQVGSPAVITTTAGAVVKAMTWSAFGELLTDSAPGFASPLGYAGGIADGATGFVRMGLRDYDPATGRFTSRDPLGTDGGDANLYAYAASDPIQNSDPTGLVSAGGTICEGGVCGGVKWGWNEDGLSVCGEIGLGAGNDISFNPLGGPEDTKIYIKESAELGLGPIASVEVGAELNTDFTECRKKIYTGTVCVVGACIDSGDGIKLGPEKIADTLGKAAHFGLEAKIMTGYCHRIF